MLLQGLHALFLGFQILVAWEFLIKGIELRPEVAQKFHLSDVNRHIYPYLTVWNLVLHITYLIACAAEDVFTAVTNEKYLSQFKKKFSKNRAFVFGTVVFPGSLLVVTAYWILITMNPLYLFPGPIEELIPAWINFLIHSGVGIFAVAEVILRNEAWSSRHMPKRLQVGGTILIAYAIVICLHRYLSGAWIYPFIEHTTWPQRVGIYIMLASTAALWYNLGYHLSHAIHGITAVRTKQT